MEAAALRCDVCAEPAMAVAPGTDPAVCDLFAVTRGERPRAWCWACWVRAFCREEVSA
jgi:hypothetical protein